MTRRPSPASGNARRAIGYLRGSPRSEMVNPEIEEEQRAALRAWCRAHGAELVAIYDELVCASGPLDERHALLGALDGLRKLDAGVLVVARRERVGSAVQVALVQHLARTHGAVLAIADELEGERLVSEGDLAEAFAELERVILQSRSSAAIAIRRARGSPSGEPPYGFRDEGGTLEPEPREQATLELIRRLRAMHFSVREIRAQLEAMRLPPRGLRWHLTTLQRILRRQRSEGLRGTAAGPRGTA